jgi:predicted nucleic acid-binding protein
LLLFEFRQSIQFKLYRYSKDHNQGYSSKVGLAALSLLKSDSKMGVFRQMSVDWADVHAIAERLAFQYTQHAGHTSFDMLHIATALHLGVTGFLTFDDNQRKLAESEGLTVSI